MGVAWEIDPRASVLVLRRECGKRVIAEGASASFELLLETALEPVRNFILQRG